MNRIFLSVALFSVIAVSAVSVHARPAHKPSAQIIAANWIVAEPQSLQSAGVHSLIATSFHAVHAGY